MPSDLYYRKDMVQAEWNVSLECWKLRRYDVDSDKFMCFNVSEEVFRKFYFKEEDNAQHQQEAGEIHGSNGAQPELREEGRDTSEGRQGVQQGRSDKEGAEEQVTVWHVLLIDGWMRVPKKYRMPYNSGRLITMNVASWRRLANCANPTGEFYIPCTKTLNTNQQLRTLVAQLEMENA